MSLSVTAAAVTTCFIASHTAPANYLATFSKELREVGYNIDIYALGKAANNAFISRKTPPKDFFDLDALSSKALDEAAKKIASCYRKVIIDVAHPKNIELIERLKQHNPEILITAFYDNPDVYVPGGYSIVAAKVLLVADNVLFVNANHEKDAIYEEFDKEISLPSEKRIGLGCYPLKKVEKLLEQRIQKQAIMRARLFSEKLYPKYRLKDEGQKILVYFGGNNEEYFTNAFPAFLRFLSEAIKRVNLSNIVIVLQQHPGAKNIKSKKSDRQKLEIWIKEYGIKRFAPKIVISDQNSNDMQILADGVLYHQTSMGPLFALTSIDMIQVGDKLPYKDSMVDRNICPSVTNSSELVKAMQNMKAKSLSEKEKNTIYKALGIRDDWFIKLKQVLELN